MVIIDIVINTLLAILTLDPAGMHCPAWDQGRIKGLRGPRPIPNSSGGYIHGVGRNLAIVDGNRRLSLKRCEIGQVTIKTFFRSFRETDYSYAYTFL